MSAILRKITSGQLYMLTDVLGITAKVVKNPYSFNMLSLEGSRLWTFSLPALNLDDMPKSRIVEAYLSDSGPPIVEVTMMGNLHYVLMLDNKEEVRTLRLFLIDRSKGPSPVPTMSSWSRQDFYRDLVRVMTAEYRLDGVTDKWVAVPKARALLTNYLTARMAGVSSSMADAVAVHMLAHDLPPVEAAKALGAATMTRRDTEEFMNRLRNAPALPKVLTVDDLTKGEQ